MEKGYGYHENPVNGDGIKRAKTTGQLRSLEIPRNLRALNIIHTEFDESHFPGIYLLFHETKREVYVGEAKSIFNRLNNHINTHEEKIKDWHHVLIINDGRAANHSEFNDTVIRKSLELNLIKIFKLNKYKVLSQGQSQRLNAEQKSINDRLWIELSFLLYKQNLITKFFEDKKEEEVLIDELRKILEDKGYIISKWGSKNAIINDRKVFIRPGSPKPKGWQVTIRGKQPGSFIDCTQRGEGDLIMPRDGVLYIPLSEIQKILEPEAYEKDTIDVFIEFDENKIILNYKKKSMDITRFKILD